MKRYSIFQKHKAKGNMTWYGRISESGLFHVVSLGTKKKAKTVAIEHAACESGADNAERETGSPHTLAGVVVVFVGSHNYLLLVLDKTKTAGNFPAVVFKSTEIVTPKGVFGKLV